MLIPVNPKILSFAMAPCAIADAKLPRNPIKNPGVNIVPESIEPSNDFESASTSPFVIPEKKERYRTRKFENPHLPPGTGNGINPSNTYTTLLIATMTPSVTTFVRLSYLPFLWFPSS